MIKFTDAQNYLIEYCNIKLESMKIEKTQHRFVCPFCNSGKKGNQTASFTIVKNSNGTHYKCFSCGAHGDVFDLIQSIEHLESQKQAIEHLEAIFDFKIDKRTLPKGTGKKPTNDKIKPLYDENNQPSGNAKANLKTLAFFNKDNYENLKQSKWALKHLYARGFNDETIKQFQIGFDKKINCIMLPYPKCYSVLKYNPMMQPKYNASGTNPNDIYNVDVLKQGKPTFVCEGVFDCMSVCQCGFNAIAILGTGNANHLIDYVIKNNIETPLIIMFDIDADQKQNELCQRLYESKKIAFGCNAPKYMHNNFKNVNDANDCLKANAKTFTKLLQHNYDVVEKKQFDLKTLFATNKK